jgi:hypothetical protein
MSEEKKSIFKKWWFYVGILVVAGIIGGQNDNQSGSSSESSLVSSSSVQATPEPVQLEEMDIAVISTAYEQNEARADRDYKGKRYIFGGFVDQITQDFADDTIVEFKGSNQFLNVNAELRQTKRNIDMAIDLNGGDYVKLACTVEGEIIGTPSLGDCDFPE